MTTKRKVLLTVILGIVLAIHVALFAAGGSWRTMGLALVAIDLFSAWFVIGAVREMKKLDQQEARVQQTPPER